MLCWTWAGIADFRVLYGHPISKRTMLGTDIRITVSFGALGMLLIMYSS